MNDAFVIRSVRREQPHAQEDVVLSHLPIVRHARDGDREVRTLLSWRHKKSKVPLVIALGPGNTDARFRRRKPKVPADVSGRIVLRTGVWSIESD